MAVGLDVGRSLKFLPRGSVRLGLLLSAIFLGSFAVRLPYIGSIDFAPLRNHRSALVARAYYYEANDSVPEWERAVYRAQRTWMDLLEPPVMEHLAVGAYRIAGGEYLWIPRLFSVLFWTAGGILMYLCAGRVLGLHEALFATSIYLLVPFGVVASRSFMPDPLMIMMFLVSLYALVRYFEAPSQLRLLVAAVSTGLAVFIKAFCFFPLLGAFVSLAWWKGGLKGGIVGSRTVMFLPLAALPGALYYGYGFFAGWGVRSQLLSSVHPELLVNPTFWAGWLAQIHLVVTLSIFFLGLVGLLYLKRGFAKSLLLGLWGGYFVFGLTVTYHVSTHDYYHLMLIPIAALSAAPVLVNVVAWLEEVVDSRRAGMIMFLCCIGLGFASGGIKILQYNLDRHGRWQQNERRIAPEIGDLVGHSTKTVFLSISNGLPLAYYGRIGGAEWGHRNEAIETYIERGPRFSPQEALTEENLGFEPEYFIVTELLEFKRQQALRDFLFENHPLIAHADDYLIFDLRTQSGSAR